MINSMLPLPLPDILNLQYCKSNFNFIIIELNINY
jgi:hypothetical protein